RTYLPYLKPAQKYEIQIFSASYHNNLTVKSLPLESIFVEPLFPLYPKDLELIYDKLTPYSFEISWEPPLNQSRFDQYVLHYNDVHGNKQATIKYIDKKLKTYLINEFIKPGRMYQVDLLVKRIATLGARSEITSLQVKTP